jgi:hypothetical protein
MLVVPDTDLDCEKKTALSPTSALGLVKVFYDPVIAKLIPVAATTPPLRPD